MREAYNQLAEKHGVSVEAVEVLAQALRRGSGTQAQFNHPDLGGSGQWMPGMVMVGDMFNDALKAKVNALVHDVREVISNAHTEPTRDEAPAGFDWNWGMVMEPWWDADLGTPSASGGQNDMAYAYFPQKSRLAVKVGDSLTVYDTTGHLINGVSQQQQDGGSVIMFSSQRGVMVVTHLRVVSRG